MKSSWKVALAGLLAMVAIAAAPRAGHAQGCGDVNGDGAVNANDVQCLQSCAATGTCPNSVFCGNPANICGAPGGAIKACTDVFADGLAPGNLGKTLLDVNTLAQVVVGLDTLHDPCVSTGTIHAGCPTNPADPTIEVGIAAGTISDSEIWPRNCRLRLDGTVFVSTPALDPTTVITIESGSTVVGNASAGGGQIPALIFLPGSKIAAAGTETRPIVFTSNKTPGTRGAQDWGGVSINGKSTVNGDSCLANAEGIPVPFGGCIVDDSSGVLTFARIEFAGKLFTPNNELNNLTMNGVGRGTVLNHVQGHFGADDTLEWFGGTVNGDHLIGSASGDDGIDWQLGYTGSVQFALVIQNGVNMSCGNGECRGIEADNSEFGFDREPVSDPRMCNLTLVGDRTNAQSDVGIFLRRGTRGVVSNSIVTNWLDAGAEIRDVNTSQEACTGPAGGPPSGLTGKVLIRNSVLFSNGDLDPGAPVDATEQTQSGAFSQTEDPPAAPVCTSLQWYGLLAAQGVVNAQGSNAVNPGQSLTYPAAGQLYAAKPTGTATLPNAGLPNCSTLADSLVDTNYVGAFDPADPKPFGWLSGVCVNASFGKDPADPGCDDNSDCVNGAFTTCVKWVSFDLN